MNRDEYRSFEGKIENWRQALRYGLVAARCGSAERYFKPSRGLGDEAPASVLIIDIHAAWAMEDAWVTLMTPWAKWMIKWHFVSQFSVSVIVRMLQARRLRGIRHDTYERELFVAVELLKRNLDMRAGREYRSNLQLDPTETGVSRSRMAALSRPKETKPAKV